MSLVFDNDTFRSPSSNTSVSSASLATGTPALPIHVVSDEWFHAQVVGALVGRLTAWIQETLAAIGQPPRLSGAQRSR